MHKIMTGAAMKERIFKILCSIFLVILMFPGCDDSSNKSGGNSGGNFTIYFSSDRDTHSGTYQVYSIKSSGSGLTRISNSTVDEMSPVISPDSMKIAYHDSSVDKIYVMDVNGSNVQALSSGSNDRTPNWSPDGTKIVYCGHDGDTEIMIMNADGTNQTNLTNNTLYDSNPSFSSDGTLILYQSTTGGMGDTPEIYSMNTDGTNQVQLTNNSVSDRDPEMSPDGTKIVYISDSHLYVMDPDGSNQTPVYTDSTVYNPFWSSDGTKIIFLANDGDLEIYTINPDGTGLAQVTNNSVTDTIHENW